MLLACGPPGVGMPWAFTVRYTSRESQATMDSQHAVAQKQGVQKCKLRIG